MEKHAKLISFISFIGYSILNYYFVSFSVTNQIKGISGEINDLNKLLEDISHENLVLIITIITVIATTAFLLMQYIIGKFLLFLFASDVQSHLFYVLIPKIFITVINIFFMRIWQINNSWLYIFTSLLGAIAVLLFFQHIKENWKASMLFAAALIFDPLLSLGKEIFSLL